MVSDSACISRCFNGAAFFQSGKCRRRAAKRIQHTPLASMEPLFFKAENTGGRPNATEGSVTRFNGAAFFQSGKLGGALPSLQRT